MRSIPTLLILLQTLLLQAQDCAPSRYLNEVFDQVTVTSGIKFGEADPYGVIGSQDLLLDLYQPTGDLLEKRPVIIYAFGGGFLIGFRNQPPIPEFCTHFAKLGYVVAAIDYRIGFNTTSSGSAERAVYRGVQDLRAAMRFLGQFSAGYGIDTTNIFLTGSSAGCFSALHSTFMEESDRPQSTYGILLEPGNMGCADCSGNTYLNGRELRPKGIINHWGAMLDTSFIDPTAKDNVPVISFHGTDDLIVPYNSGSPFSYPIFPVVRGSAPIHQRLNNLGITNRLIPLDGIGHEPWLTEPRWLDTVYRHAPPFLYEILRPQTSPISGDMAVAVGSVHTYSVTGQPGSQFCWTVTGGTIIADNGSSVDVLWNTSGTWEVSVTEVNTVEAVGTEQTLTVEVAQPTSVTEDRTTGILFPNPADEVLRLNLNNSNGHQTIITIVDLNGRTVLETWSATGNGTTTLNISSLAPGSYVVKAEGISIPFVKAAR